MRLAIVIGHSKESPGAYAAPPLRLSEYDYNTQLAQEIYRNAMSRGVHTKIFKRDGVGIAGVYRQVEDWAAKTIYGKTCSVELHFNSAESNKAKGTETLFDDEPVESVELAREVHQFICRVFSRKGKEDRGLKKLVHGDRGYTNLSSCRISSCLIEPFFGNNPDEAKMADERQAELAKAIVDGVVQYFVNLDRQGPLN